MKVKYNGVWYDDVYQYSNGCILIKELGRAFNQEDMECIGTEKQSKRPPLGIMPKDIFRKKVDQERLGSLQDVIARYYNADLPIKIEWIEEYNELISNKKEIWM